MEITIGVGLAILFFLLQYVVKIMPSWFAWGGISFSILLILWGISGKFLEPHRLPIYPILLFIICISGIVTSILWYKAKVNVGSEIIRVEPLPSIKMMIITGATYTYSKNQQLTGIPLRVRIWNEGEIGYPLVDWELFIENPGEPEVRTQPSEPPPELYLNSKNILHKKDFSLQRDSSSRMIEPGGAAVEGWILFYAPLPKNKMNKDTKLIFKVKDTKGHIFSHEHKIGDWVLSTEDLAPKKSK